MPNVVTALHRPRRHLFAGLNARLVLLVLLTLLPAAGLICYLGVTQRRWVLHETEEQLVRLSRLGASRLVEQIEATHHTLAAWSELPSVRDFDVASCQQVFPRLATHYPFFANIGLIQPDGELVCSGAPFAPPMDLSDRTYFRRAVETRQFAVGQYQIERVTGKAAVNFGYPLLTDAGAVRGVLFAALDLSWLRQLAVEMQLPVGGRLTVLNNDGSVVYAYPAGGSGINPLMLQASLLSTILQHSARTAHVIRSHGTLQLLAFTPVRLGPANPPMYLAVSLPADTVFAKADRALAQTFLWLGLVGALALLLTRWLAERVILHPVRTLVRVSTQLAEGDLAARTGLPHGAGELNELARAFDDMATALDQRNAERKRLQQDVTLLEAFPELYPHPIVEADTAGLVTYRNPAALTTFPDLPLLGCEHSILHGVAVEILKARHHKRTSFVREVIYHETVYEQRVYLIANSARVHIYMLDITERKRAEAELAQTYERLKTTHAQLVQSEKLASVGILAAGIAHELKNPLGIILQGISFLERAQHASPEMLQDAITSTKKAVVRADAIIRGLLTFTRQTTSQPKPVNLNDVIVASLLLVEKQLMVRNVTIEQHLTSEPAFVQIDENQLQQVFINLMVNAIQAMPQGGRLTLTTAVQTLTTLGYGVGRRADDFFTIGQRVVVCSVTDTGTGIPPDHISKVFDPFFTTKAVGEGTGLGLSIVQSIIDSHRGLVTIDSQVGVGTTMRITLGALPDGPPPAA